jgi:formamidopyrimidine-DNA glycosylase
LLESLHEEKATDAGGRRMPELPEMETYRRLLEEKIGGLVVTESLVEREKTINLAPQIFNQTLIGKRLIRVLRRGKHPLFELESDHVLLLHLMLGGFLYWGTATDKLERSTQVTLSFGSQILYFHGLRLGYLHLLRRDQADERLADLGPEPLAPAFTLPQFIQLTSKKRSLLSSRRSALACRDRQLLCGRNLFSCRPFANQADSRSIC